MLGRAAYPDKGSVGAAAHNFGGQLRLAASATIAAAALYGAVVVFGLGPSSPSALGTIHLRPPQVVHVRAHVLDRVAPSPARRRPQASAGPARHRPHATRRRVARAARSVPAPLDRITARTEPPTPQLHADWYSAPAATPPPAQEAATATVPTLPVTLPAVEAPALSVSELPVGLP
jgi:hypothetical protein